MTNSIKAAIEEAVAGNAFLCLEDSPANPEINFMWLHYQNTNLFNVLNKDENLQIIETYFGIGKPWVKHNDGVGYVEEEGFIKGSQSYLGYVPEEDIFIIAYDLTLETGLPQSSLAAFKIENEIVTFISERFSSYLYKTFAEAGYQQVIEQFPSILDLKVA